MNMGQCAYDNMCSSFSDFGILGSYIALSMSLFLNCDSILFQFYPDKIRIKCGESEFVKNLYLLFFFYFVYQKKSLNFLHFFPLKKSQFLTQLEVCTRNSQLKKKDATISEN